MDLSSVVLPAPFGPTRPTKSPRATSRSMSSSTRPCGALDGDVLELHDDVLSSLATSKRARERRRVEPHRVRVGCACRIGGVAERVGHLDARSELGRDVARHALAELRLHDHGVHVFLSCLVDQRRELGGCRLVAGIGLDRGDLLEVVALGEVAPAVVVGDEPRASMPASVARTLCVELRERGRERRARARYASACFGSISASTRVSSGTSASRTRIGSSHACGSSGSRAPCRRHRVGQSSGRFPVEASIVMTRGGLPTPASSRALQSSSPAPTASSSAAPSSSPTSRGSGSKVWGLAPGGRRQRTLPSLADDLASERRQRLNRRHHFDAVVRRSGVSPLHPRRKCQQAGEQAGEPARAAGAHCTILRLTLPPAAGLDDVELRVWSRRSRVSR